MATLSACATAFAARSAGSAPARRGAMSLAQGIAGESDGTSFHRFGPASPSRDPLPGAARDVLGSPVVGLPRHTLPRS